MIINSSQHAFHETTNGTIQIKLTVKDNNVHIDYRDNGSGLNAKQREKVFEPFYTTARSQGGTGLGMSISYNIVTAKLKGEIHCLESDKGAHFSISFPVELD